MDSAERGATFRELHEAGCFVIPNPWDAGTAKALASLGFPALATTSAGFAYTRGLPDTPDALEVEDVIAHAAEIVSATDLPVNVDFQAGYADEPEGVAENVRRCAAAGVSGISIEDMRPGGELYEFDEAVERVSAAVAATGPDVLLTARAECFLVADHPDPLAEAVSRLQAYAEAGAEVLYAPGPTERSDIQTIIDAVAPLPVNVLMRSDTGMRVADLAEMGARRISVGSTFARVAWTAFLRAAREVADEGTFTTLGEATPFDEIEALF